MRSALPVLLFDLGQEVLERGLVGGVARQHFVGEGKTLGRNHEGDDDLHAVAALIAAVAEAAQIGGIGGRIAFKIRAGQIVEEHFVLRLEEVAPAGGKVIKERRLVGYEFVVAFVEAMNFRERKIRAEQIGDGRVIEPMPVQPPLRTRINEPVEHEGLQDLIPACAFAAGGEFVAPELAQTELLPQFAAQPARAPLARTAQGHLPQSHAHDGELLALDLRRSVRLGKERDLLWRVLVLAEEFDGFAPGGFLHAIEFAEVEDVALDDALVGQTTIFDNAPVKMFFAIFAAL